MLFFFQRNLILNNSFYYYQRNRFTNTTERVGMTERVYFHWVCSDPRGFEWLLETLHSLEATTRKHGSDRFLHIHVHWTKGWTEDDVSIFLGAI